MNQELFESTSVIIELKHRRAMDSSVSDDIWGVQCHRIFHSGYLDYSWNNEAAHLGKLGQLFFSSYQ